MSNQPRVLSQDEFDRLTPLERVTYARQFDQRIYNRAAPAQSPEDRAPYIERFNPNS